MTNNLYLPLQCCHRRLQLGLLLLHPLQLGVRVRVACALPELLQGAVLGSPAAAARGVVNAAAVAGGDVHLLQEAAL